MKGTMAMMAAGGPNRHSRERRLMKLALVVAGRWFVGDRKVSRWRSTRERYLLCSSFGV